MNALFYAATTPGVFGVWTLRVFLTHLAGAAATALLLLAFWGLGGPVWRRGAGENRADGLEHVGRAALGAGFAGLLLLALGGAGLLRAPALCALAVLAAACALPEAAARVRRMRLGGMAGPFETGLLAFCSVAGFGALLAALAPPAQWDVLAYHLSLPKIYAETGRVMELPWLLHSHWPHLTELLYVVPMSLGLDAAPALLHLSFSAAWAYAVYREGARESGPRVGLFAAALLCAHPIVLRHAGAAHADGAWALFSFLTAMCLSRGRFGLSAVFAGFAVSCKLLGALSLPGWALWVALDARGGRRAALRWSATAALVAAPWFLKTWWSTGNPVWPFCSGLFGGGFGGPGFVAAYEASNRWSWPPSAAWFMDNGLPFLLVPLAGSWLLKPRAVRVPVFLKLLWFPAPLHLALTLTHNEAARFFQPFYPAAALTTAWACAEIWRGAGRARKTAVAALGAFALSPLFSVSRGNELFAVLGLRSTARPDATPRRAYLSRALDHFQFYEDVNALLAGTAAKILLFREIRGYYLDVDYLWGDPLNQGLIAYDSLRDDRALEERLRSLGVTHVLVNEGVAMYAPGGPVYERRVAALMASLLARSRVVAARGALSLHELPVAR